MPVGASRTGELRLGVERRSGRSVIASQLHAGALRVLRPHYPDGSGQPVLALVNPGGGYLGGDRYRIDAGIARSAGLTLTTQSATKVYRTPQGHARMEQRFVLAAGARLEFLPDSLIAYRGASYQQRTEVVMHRTSSLVLAEIVTHGWSPDGASFAFDRISLGTRVTVSDELAVMDRLLLEPGRGGTGRLMLAGYSHLASLLVIDPRCDDTAVAELREVLDVRDAEPDRLIGITRLRVPGFALRVLTRSTPQAAAILVTAVDWTRATWHEQPPLALRKP